MQIEWEVRPSEMVALVLPSIKFKYVCIVNKLGNCGIMLNNLRGSLGHRKNLYRNFYESEISNCYTTHSVQNTIMVPFIEVFFDRQVRL